MPGKMVVLGTMWSMPNQFRARRRSHHSLHWLKAYSMQARECSFHLHLLLLASIPDLTPPRHQKDRSKHSFPCFRHTLHRCRIVPVTVAVPWQRSSAETKPPLTPNATAALKDRMRTFIWVRQVGMLPPMTRASFADVPMNVLGSSANDPAVIPHC